jgi:hypothetical protein
MAGKGSKPRPVKKSVWDNNFDEIFKNPKDKVDLKKESNQSLRGKITQEIYENILRDTKHM